MPDTTPIEIPLLSPFVKRLRDATDRTLSEEFHTCSPNTQMHIKDMTGGVTPTSRIKNPRRTAVRNADGTTTVVDATPTNIDMFNQASEYEKEMMFRHGLIPPNCETYREYARKHAKTT